MSSLKQVLDTQETEELTETLKHRFQKNMHRHGSLKWTDVQLKLEKDTAKLPALYEMERTGGEPDVVAYDTDNDEYLFSDCAAESPEGRRSACYDRAARELRKKHKPETSAVEMAAAMGIELLDEAMYCYLQKLEVFDTKTSSWLKTPESVRERGGALFGDRRYGRVFIYHNGAESYYAARGFRGQLKV